jgi:divalent metal cation (Fe/Co/Zn/Cd) transporter
MLGSRIQKSRVKPFSSVIISSLVFLAGLFLLTRMVWQINAIHLWGFPSIALAILLLLMQVKKIHSVYKSARSEAEENNALRQTLNALNLTFSWGVLIFVALVAAVFQAFLLHK